MTVPAVVLLTMARSRSSMTAEIFRQHGVFFGDTWRPEDHRVGYNEHKWLKRQVQKMTDRGDLYAAILRDKPTAPQSVTFSQFMAQLRLEGYINGPWGVKADVFCFPMFGEVRSGWVGLWRDPDDIAASCERALGRRPPGDWDKIIKAHHDTLWDLGVPIIDTDKLVAGDDGALAAAIERLGIPYDANITDQVISC